MARLLLLRHGQSEWNALGRWQGVADPPLTRHGEDQARAAAGWLRGHGITGVVSSDLQRAVRTAELIADELGLPAPSIEPGLRERDVGEWSGKNTDEIDAMWPGAIQAWRAGELDRPPGGESNAELTERVMEVVGRLARRPDDETLVAVTHGGVIHTVGAALGAAWHGNANLTGWWVEPGPTAGLRARPPEGDEMAAARTVVL